VLRSAACNFESFGELMTRADTPKPRKRRSDAGVARVADPYVDVPLKLRASDLAAISDLAGDRPAGAWIRDRVREALGK
jgi:hypothetical protein